MLSVVRWPSFSRRLVMLWWSPSGTWSYLATTSPFRSCWWLMSASRMSYLISHTSTSALCFLVRLASVKCNLFTCSSSLVTVSRPSTSSSLQITYRCFSCASLCLFVSGASSLWLSRPLANLSVFDSALPVPVTSSSSHHSRHIKHPHCFTPGLKSGSFTNPSHHRLYFFLRTNSMDYNPDCIFCL